MRILVIGATGMLGQPITRRLVSDGYDVRLLVRNVSAARRIFGADVDIVAGDVTEPDSLPSAMRSCDAVYVSLRGGNTVASYERVERVGAANVAAAAARCGVSRLAYVSGAGIGEYATKVPLFAVKAAAVAAIEASGVEYIIFKPTHFMESLPQFVRAGRAVVIGHQPHQYHYLAASDYAGLVSRTFRMPAAANQSLTIFGPEALTMVEALRLYCSVVLPDTPVQTMPMWLARSLGWLTRNPDLRFAATLFEAFSQFGERGSPDATERLLGPSRITLAQWCQQHLIRSQERKR